MAGQVLKFEVPGPGTTVKPIQTASSFGMDLTTLGPAYNANGLINSDRVRNLQYRESYFTATHHDWKTFDMNGRMIRPGKLGTQPLLSGAVPAVYVPLDQRRPSNPYRLGRKIVSSFTGMVFGYGRFPQFRSDDPDTADWCQGVSDAVGLEPKMIRARNLGGRCGTVGLSWALDAEGKPRVGVHKGWHIHVLEWADEDERVPAHVTSLYQGPMTGGDPGRWYWHRRDWTPTADVVFVPAEVKKNDPPLWQIDEKQSCAHNHGKCHFVWIENLPDDDDDTGCDGAPDYAEEYEPMSSLDMLNSVNYRGAVLNLDPTVVLGVDQEEIGKAVIKKGSDNSLVVGKGGTASYMELSGSAIVAGTGLVKETRNQILEVAECVVPDPNQVVAAGTSSVALRMLYHPMLGKCDIFRYQYGSAITRLLQDLTDYCRARVADPKATEPEQKYVTVEEPEEYGEGEEPTADEPAVREVLTDFYVNIPPRVVTEPVKDATGAPTGDVSIEIIERTPGKGRIWLEWGPYFKTTADDDQKESGALSTAAGGKPVMSQQTAVELHSNIHDRDGQEEWIRVQREAAEDAKRSATANAAMYPGIGGGPGEEEQAESNVAAAP